MSKLSWSFLILVCFVFQSCDDSTGDYVCSCDYTLGATTGNKSYDITGATQDEANAECDDYESSLGGNAKCNLQ